MTCTHEGCSAAIKTHTIDRFPRTLGEHGYQNGPLADIQMCQAGHVEKVAVPEIETERLVADLHADLSLWETL